MAAAVIRQTAAVMSGTTGRDRGSGTALALLAVTLGGFLILLTTSLAAVVLARHRAGAAADLAALAAAAPSVPQRCEQARRVAEANRAGLRSCRMLDDGSVLVGVEVTPAGRLAQLLGPALVEARAGPVGAGGMPGTSTPGSGVP